MPFHLLPCNQTWADAVAEVKVFFRVIVFFFGHPLSVLLSGDI